MIESRVSPPSVHGLRWPGVGLSLIMACSLLLATSVVVGRGVQHLALLLVAVAVLAAWHEAILRWRVLLCLVLAVVLFVPIGRYSFPIDLPFDVEPYRVAVAIVLAGWLASLLVDRRITIRRSPFDRPVLTIVLATFASVLVNFSRVVPLETAVLKSVTFFLSFVIFYYFIVSIIRTKAAVFRVTQFIVVGASIISASSMIEQRSRFSVFDHLRAVAPFLRFDPTGPDVRDGVVRAMGSAEHPIALGVLLAMALPLALALAKGLSGFWFVPAVVIAIGLFATASRTPILCLLGATLTLMWLRPRETVRLIPLAVPLLIMISIAVPGSVATVKNAFFPEGGLVAEQTVLPENTDPDLVGGRVRQLGPMLREAGRTPVFGQGAGTRQTGFDNPLRNAPILDNQWLGLLLEVGLVGIVGWIWLIAGGVRRLGHVAPREGRPTSWLAAGFAASIVSFAVGMFTYDSLAFVQEAFVFWVILALSASLLLSLGRDTTREPSRRLGGSAV